MDVNKLYILGEMVEVTTNKNYATIVKYYTKGKNFAKQILGRKISKNTSLPTKQLKEIAGIVDITETEQINACCFAKLFNSQANDKVATPIDSTTNREMLFNSLNKKLLSIPLAHFLTESPASIHNTDMHVAMGARAFAEYSSNHQEEILDTLFDESESCR